MTTFQTNDATGAVVIQGSARNPIALRDGYTLRQVDSIPAPPGILHWNGTALERVPPPPVVAPDDRDLAQSPLWPLQMQLRAFFQTAMEGGQATATQVARVTAVQTDTESLFAQWRNYSAISFLRSVIRDLVSPPQLDFSGSDLLSGFQTELLALSHWSDTLPS